VIVTLSKFKVLKLLNNSFKLFISGSDFIPKRGDNFISLLFDGFLEFSKFILNAEEVVLEFL
jgi:hypothetical protein